MKKGIIQHAFGTMNLDELIALAKKYGYDGFEVFLSDDEDSIFKPSASDEELLALKKKVEDAGLSFYSMMSGDVWKFNIASDDEEERKNAFNLIKREIEVAAILGVKSLLVVPGMVHNLCNPDRPVIPYDKAYDRALAAFTELAKYAEEYKVQIGLENVANCFLLSPLELRDFIDKIGSDYVGVYFDVGNVIQIGYPEHWIRILGKRIVKIHIKDMLLPLAETKLLTGLVNFPEVMKALKEVGYDGWLTPELVARDCTVEEMLQDTSNVLDKLIQM